MGVTSGEISGVSDGDEVDKDEDDDAANVAAAVVVAAAAAALAAEWIVPVTVVLLEGSARRARKSPQLELALERLRE